MTVGAVIAEYNPFHNGHKYQLDLIKSRYNIDKLIVIMSGDFTERGEPAILGKEARAKHALYGGADLVLLLPLVYATSGADLFAYGAVSLLNRLNVVDYLFFGAECDDMDLLKEIAIKSLESDKEISNGLKSGVTYAKSRELLFPEYGNIISSPNNILAIEYIKSLLLLQSTITPVAIKRTDDNYNSETLANDIFASARTVRRMVYDNDTDAIQSYVPEYTEKDLSSLTNVSFDDFSSELYYSLLMNRNNLSDFLDISEDLQNRIRSYLDSFNGCSDFVELIKAKNFTHTRISRGMLHVLLGIKGTNSYYKDLCNKITHIRILGFRKSASELLSVIGRNSSIVLTSKVPDVYHISSPETQKIFDIELTASILYSRKSDNKVSEYQRPISIIDL